MGTLAMEQDEKMKEESNVGELSKLLKSQQLKDVPQRYVVKQSKDLLPNNQFTDLPVIDLLVLKSDPERVLKEIGEAVAEHGFLQIVNHNVPLELIKRHEALALEFFNLPTVEKQKGSINNHRGYNGGFSEDWGILHGIVLPWREALLLSSYAGDNTLQKFVERLWPEGNPTFIEIWRSLKVEIAKVSHQMHELLALSLGLSRDFFTQHYAECDPEQEPFTIAWNHYPANPCADRVLGARGHVDTVCLTILWQDDVGGLQIDRNGEWIGVRPVEGALVVNIGDLMQAWTNDKYVSTKHRVVTNSERGRFSIAAFIQPDASTVISAPDELVDDQHPRKYRPFTREEYQTPSEITAKFSPGTSKLPAFLI